MASPNKSAPKRDGSPLLVDLALQGGGAHGAFTWGVLDRLLDEPNIQIEGISGTSAGAMNAAVLVSGQAAGGAEGAKAALEQFWRRVSEAALLSPFRRTPLDIVFSDPQMAVVGRPYSQLDRAHVEIGAIDYSDQGRAVVMAKNAGLVRIYAERETARIIGAEMFGPRVEHTAHLLAWAVARDLDVDTALHMPFYHPVVEEGIRTAIRDLCARLKLAAEPRPKDLECGPGV